LKLNLKFNTHPPSAVAEHLLRRTGNSKLIDGRNRMESHIAVFKGKEIRKTIHNNEWWFSVSDVVEALTDSTDPKQYIKK
jgi:hypothetical protein